MHPVNIFSKVSKTDNNFWHNDGTEKLQSYVESWSMDDFKNVHHFAV